MALHKYIPQIQGHSIKFAEILMARQSVTPSDGGCQTFLMHRLSKLGFDCRQYRVEGVSNLIAKWGRGNPHIAFCGHTDVVHPGPADAWDTHPFCPTVSENKLYGRGAADMKSGIAAMLAATERCIPVTDPQALSFWWLITSDEEGEAEYGSKWIAQQLEMEGVELDGCIVGEPTAAARTGDTIKIGRRGSLSGTISVTGKQGHVAYPHTCDNAIHRASTIIHTLLQHPWEKGTDDFPGTSLQITHLDTGAFTDNLAPGRCRIEFNVRYSAAHDQDSLADLLRRLIKQADPAAVVSWSRPCDAYFSQPRENCLITTTEQAIVATTGRYPLVSTSGGTSDGRFFASSHTQVVEIGVPNTSIHQANEYVHLSDVLTLEDIYTDILYRLAHSPKLNENSY